MNRRVLLIDLDPTFCDQLIRLVGRYRVVVMHEPDADRALALAAADPPAAVIISVDEPEKAGFRVFQKFKKGALASIPIVLVTSSVTADAFAKHRGLRLHADEYLDKRTLTDDELVAKIDNLIGLGDLQEDEDLSIPIEDDIPMELGDGDVVLDETVGVDEPVGDDGGASEFVHEARTVGPEGIRVDSVVEAETDAAFDALLGDDSPPAGAKRRAASYPRAGSEPAIVHARPPSEPFHDAVPEAVPHPNRREPEDAESADAVPQAVSHPSVAHDSDSDVLEEDPVAPLEIDDRFGGDVDQRDDLSVDRSSSSSSSVALAEHDLVAMEEDEGTDVHADVHELQSPPAPEVGGHGRMARAQSEPVITSATRPSPAHTEEPTGARDPISPEETRKSGTFPAIDLGLEAVASDADREQSGIHDRRALRKIGELDRQITQLKHELDRARAAAESAAKGGGREAQFLNLREQVLAKDKELIKAKADVTANEQELADAREKLKQAQHARAAFEAKNTELEQRIFEGGDRSKDLEAAVRDATARTGKLEDQVNSVTRALAEADTARKRAEQELVDERARRAATASEAERSLRAEREQLVARHGAELAALHDHAANELDAALARLREQLHAEHAQAIEDAVEELRRANAAEHEAAVGNLERQHSRQVVSLKADHTGELRRLEKELRGEIARLDGALSETRAARDAAVTQAALDKTAALEELARKHATMLETIEGEQAEARERDAEANAAAIAQMKTELDRTHATAEAKLAGAFGERDQLVADHERRIGELHDQHRAALGELQQQQAQELQKLSDDRQQLVDATKRSAESSRAALAELEQQLEARLEDVREVAAREATEQRAALQAAKRAAEEAANRHREELDAAEQAHTKALADMEAKQERALAVANGEHLKAKAISDSEHAKALAARDASVDATKRELEAEHARAVRELITERDELLRGLSSTREQLRRSEAELGAAVQTIADHNATVRQYQAAIDERDQRIAELRKELESLEQENTSYQDQVLRAYQKIKSDEAMVARARKAMAIALTVLDDEGNPSSSSS